MKFRYLLLAALLGISVVAPAPATSLVRLSLEQLSQASTEIVRGRVVSQESRWNSRQTQIVTLTTIAIDQKVKGRPPAALVIQQPGGTVGNLRVLVPGTVRFTRQSSYVLFLEPVGENSSRYCLVGMVQGAYRIFRDAGTNEERVIEPLGGVFLGHSETARGEKTSARSVALAEFRKQLSAALIAPIVVPSGTSIPVIILSAESRGVGRVRVLGRTTSAIYPSAGALIPAGSPVEGTGQLRSGRWRIHWNEVSVRGRRVAISARQEEPAGGTLRGRVLVLSVR